VWFAVQRPLQTDETLGNEVPVLIFYGGRNFRTNEEGKLMKEGNCESGRSRRMFVLCVETVLRKAFRRPVSPPSPPSRLVLLDYKLQQNWDLDKELHKVEHM